jgi:hypothetical protein
MQVWQSVKAKPTHDRGGNESGEGAQAGTVVSVNPAKPDEVVVRWDLDQVTEAVAVDELAAL